MWLSVAIVILLVLDLTERNDSQLRMDAFPAGSIEPGPSSAKDLAQQALQANIAHQYTLTKYARHLEAELQELDNLIVGLIILHASSALLTNI